MLEFAKAVLQQEAAALTQLSDRLGDTFCEAVSCILSSTGAVVISGVGKSLLVGTKISATLASTGTPSIVIHPTDAMHGDLGRLRGQDVLFALSHSGETAEISDLVDCALPLGVPIVLMTSNAKSSIARRAHIVLDVGEMREACPWGLTPTTSTTAMMALGDALALTLVGLRGFTRENFARLHPAGALGQQLKALLETQASQPYDAQGTLLSVAR
jgi:arabinose-5-phosphate isomerase